MNARFSYYLEPSADIRWNGELKGRALMDIGCYCINASRFIFGSEPTSARTIWRFDEERGVDVTTLSSLEFPEHRYASITCSMLMQSANRYEVIGTEGSLELLAGFRPEKADAVLMVKDGEGTEVVVVPGVDQYRLEIEHFSKCVLDNTPLSYPAENGMANMKAIDLIRKGVDNN